MNRFYPALKIMVTVSIVLFCGASFSYWNTNPASWDFGVRVLVGGIWAFACLLAVLFAEPDCDLNRCTRTYWKALLPVINAHANGETVEYRFAGTEWATLPELHRFQGEATNYRVTKKSEPVASQEI